MQTKLSGLWQIVRFCIAGAAGVITHYVALYCLTEYLGVWYVYSSVVGYVLNQTINFLFHKFWTFKNQNERKASRQAVEYFLLKLSLFGINTLLLYIMVDKLHLWYMGVQVVLTILLTIVSYIATGKIFKRKDTNV